MDSIRCKSLRAAASIRHDPPAIMRVDEVALYLGQSVRKTWEDIRLGRLPSVKLGGRVLVRRDDIDEALRRLTRSNKR